ncbi:hypothetical protein ABJI51_03810 [Amycolatopsis sp. NEAU-NG30]|uniref:Uncharacterized protein n=1 Tax=Amycolatopsis melonis TaxID=3156488 RepID=A0ABV0L794_9PSEU
MTSEREPGTLLPAILPERQREEMPTAYDSRGSTYASSAQGQRTEVHFCVGAVCFRVYQRPMP